MFPKKIENPKEVCLHDFITVIRDFGGKYDAAKFVRDGLTLDNIETKGAIIIIVISEAPLGGEVYRYHNRGKYWEQIGTVCGYA